MLYALILILVTLNQSLINEYVHGLFDLLTIDNLKFIYERYKYMYIAIISNRLIIPEKYIRYFYKSLQLKIKIKISFQFKIIQWSLNTCIFKRICTLLARISQLLSCFFVIQYSYTFMIYQIYVFIVCKILNVC